MDGDKIFSSIDALTAESKEMAGNETKHFLFHKKKTSPVVPLNQINTTNPKLAELWNSTSMIFGATANGIGIGTTFAIKKLADERIEFVTNFHVVEQFCETPQEINSDFDSNNEFKFPCEALFVLHDIAIDTAAYVASIDGAEPWKSEVLSLDYFDKQRDLAVFRISLPENHNVVPTHIAVDYDLSKLLVAQNTAEKLNPKLRPTMVDGIEMLPLTEFSLYLVAFTMPEKDETLIHKQWFRGAVEGVRSYENDKKLGIISALKHNIEVLPGSSGGPMAVSDGRVIGINTSVEINQFYARRKKLETYKSFFAMPSTFIKDFFEKIN